MTRNRHKVVGREKFEVLLRVVETCKGNDPAYDRWADRSCPKHPDIKLRRAGYPIICKDGDMRSCEHDEALHLDLEHQGRDECYLVGCDWRECEHTTCSVEEYVRACNDRYHVIGVRVRTYDMVRWTEFQEDGSPLRGYEVLYWKL